VMCGNEKVHLFVSADKRMHIVQIARG